MFTISLQKSVFDSWFLLAGVFHEIIWKLYEKKANLPKNWKLFLIFFFCNFGVQGEFNQKRSQIHKNAYRTTLSLHQFNSVGEIIQPAYQIGTMQNLGKYKKRCLVRDFLFPYQIMDVK